jgi:CrcB protein
LTVLLIAVAGAIGAPARYVLDAWLDDRVEGAFPWGTFAVNVSGSLIFGLLVGLQHHGSVTVREVSIFGTGFCGAFTTFSTHVFESVRLLEDGARKLATYNILGTLVVCSCAAGAGFGVAALAA